VTRWLVVQPAARDLGIGYFGSSIGGGAALVAAAEVGQRIDAVVSRGGRPDLAGDALPRMQSPTLLIVGGYDDAVIRLNKEALAELRCEKELKIVPGTMHLFEEPGALEAVARFAADWFRRHLYSHSVATD
jgi:pimeloyl-ACP methyl ester carboxylesterase